MLVFDARTARVLTTLLLFGLVLGLVALAWRTLVTFLFAIMFAYLLEPVVGGLQRRMRLPRGWAVTVLYAVLAGGLATVFLTAGPRIVQQAAVLSDLAPGISARLSSGQIAQEIGSQRGWSAQTQYRLHRFLVEHRAAIASGVERSLRELTRLAANAGWVALIPVLAIFFLVDGDRFSGTLLDQLARRQRALAADLIRDIHGVLANYIRAQIMLAGLATAVYLTGFELLRLRFAVALAAGAGLLEFIPVVGPLAAAVLVLATAFLTGYGQVWAVAVLLGVWRLVQDYVNAPRILGDQVQLHPLAVLFGVIAGAEMAGVIGVYLSVPVIAIVRVVWLRWRAYRQRPEAAEAPGPARDG